MEAETLSLCNGFRCVPADNSEECACCDRGGGRQ